MFKIPDHLRGIPNLDGYFADRKGRIWSSHSGRYRRWKRCHLISAWTDQDGYKHVTLRSPKRKRYAVHSLIASAYLGPRPDGLVCEHVNGRPGDNRAENLRYCTQLENVRRKAVHGTALVGEECPRAKLTDGQAREILALCAEGNVSFRDIARRFNIHEATVHSIKTGRTWKHLGVKRFADERPPIQFSGTADATEMREVLGFVSYKADSLGNVWSFRDAPRNRWPIPNKLKAHVHRDGYLEVRIRHPGGKYTNVQVHRLVALAWIGARPTGYMVHHKNGNRQDNRIANLEYVTARANVLHAFAHGTRKSRKDLL